MNNRLSDLKEAGFDKSYLDESTGTIHVECSQCEALVVLGIPTHEDGCPNYRSALDDLFDEG